GGGLPVGAYGGAAALMDRVSPSGGVYQAGTLSGNPLAVTAGLATLERLAADPPYGRLDAFAARLEHELAALLDGTTACVQRVGSLLTLFFGASRVRNYEEAVGCDTARFGEFFRRAIDLGVWLPPSQFEAWFVSSAHSDEDFERTVAAVR